MKNTALNIIIIIVLIALGYFIRLYTTPKPGVEYLDREVAVADTSAHKRFRSEIVSLENMVYEYENPILLEEPKNKKPLSLEKIKSTFKKSKSKGKYIYPKGSFSIDKTTRFTAEDFKLSTGDSLACTVNFLSDFKIYVDKDGKLYEDHISAMWLSDISFSARELLPPRWKRIFILNGGWDFKNKYPVVGIGFGYTYRQVFGAHLYAESNTSLLFGIHGSF